MVRYDSLVDLLVAQEGSVTRSSHASYCYQLLQFKHTCELEMCVVAALSDFILAHIFCMILFEAPSLCALDSVTLYQRRLALRGFL